MRACRLEHVLAGLEASTAFSIRVPSKNSERTVDDAGRFKRVADVVVPEPWRSGRSSPRQRPGPRTRESHRQQHRPPTIMPMNSSEMTALPKTTKRCARLATGSRRARFRLTPAGARRARLRADWPDSRIVCIAMRFLVKIRIRARTVGRAHPPHRPDGSLSATRPPLGPRRRQARPIRNGLAASMAEIRSLRTSRCLDPPKHQRGVGAAEPERVRQHVSIVALLGL